MNRLFFAFAGLSLLSACQGRADVTLSVTSPEDLSALQVQDAANAKTYDVNLTEAQLVVGELSILNGSGTSLTLVDAETVFDFNGEGLTVNKVFEDESFTFGDSNAVTLTLQSATAGNIQGSAIHLVGSVNLTDGSTKNFTADIPATADVLSVDPSCTVGGLSRPIFCDVTLRFATLLDGIDFDALAAEVANDITIDPLVDSANVSNALLKIQDNLLIAIETPALD